MPLIIYIRTTHSITYIHHYWRSIWNGTLLLLSYNSEIQLLYNIFRHQQWLMCKLIKINKYKKIIIIETGLKIQSVKIPTLWIMKINNSYSHCYISDNLQVHITPMNKLIVSNWQRNFVEWNIRILLYNTR